MESGLVVGCWRWRLPLASSGPLSGSLCGLQPPRVFSQQPGKGWVGRSSPSASVARRTYSDGGRRGRGAKGMDQHWQTAGGFLRLWLPADRRDRHRQHPGGRSCDWTLGNRRIANRHHRSGIGLAGSGRRRLAVVWRGLRGKVRLRESCRGRFAWSICLGPPSLRRISRFRLFRPREIGTAGEAAVCTAA